MLAQKEGGGSESSPLLGYATAAVEVGIGIGGGVGAPPSALNTDPRAASWCEPTDMASAAKSRRSSDVAFFGNIVSSLCTKLFPFLEHLEVMEGTSVQDDHQEPARFT